ERVWPDGVRVSITETTPIATLTELDGSSVIVGEDGQELPDAAGEGQTLVPLSVASGATDPDAAAAAMSEVLVEIPDPLRGAVQEVAASSASDVTLGLALEGASGLPVAVYFHGGGNRTGTTLELPGRRLAAPEW